MLAGARGRVGQENGWGWAGMIAVVAVLGGLYLYQRDGGKVFGPGGLTGQVLPGRPIPGITARFEPGAASHDLVLTNGFPGGHLADVDLVLTLYREDGQRPQLTLFWSLWPNGADKRVTVPADRYQKVQIRGTARKGPEPEKVRVESEWTWTWRGTGGTPPAAGSPPPPEAATVEAPPPGRPADSGPGTVAGITAGFVPGSAAHEFVLTNASDGADLTDVEVVLTFHREDGQSTRVSQSWGTWAKQEKKRVSVPAARYPKVEMRGMAASWGKKVKLESGWLWSWR